MPDSLMISSSHAGQDSAVVYHKVQHLVFEEPDSTLGSHFVGHPSPLASHVFHAQLNSNEFPLQKDSAFLAKFRELWPAPIRDIAWAHEEIPWSPTGIAGDPVDYEFRNDDYVTSLILFSFFIMAWVFASSWKFLRRQIKDFFYTRERTNLFAEREDNILRGRPFLVLQTSFFIALIFFASTRTYLPDVFTQVSAYLILGTATLVSLIYYLAKLILYNVVNHTFFSPAKCKQWNDIYLLSVLFTGCALLPVTLFVVFFDIPPQYIAIVGVLLLSVIKISLLYKCHGIFFRTRLGGMHLILYLCTLEIIPLGIFIAALIAASHLLLTL